MRIHDICDFRVSEKNGSPSGENKNAVSLHVSTRGTKCYYIALRCIFLHYRNYILNHRICVLGMREVFGTFK